MDMILISDTKLKIMLSPLDMEEFSLTGDDMDYSKSETRRAFRSILDKAKHFTGFDAACTRVFIQVYPSRSGGCELYVTKLGRSDFSSDDRKRIDSDDKIGNAARSDDIVQNDPYCSVYRFDTMNLMLSAVSRLHGMGFDGHSSAYTENNGTRCYLAISTDGHEAPYDRYSFIGEYGESLDRDILKLYINEYCKCICASDAVNILDSVS